MSFKSARAAVLFAGALVLAASQAKAAHHPRSHHGHAVHHAGPVAPRQIACTVLGCMPIPAACMPVAGKTLGGRPTGFDVIVCPPGVWPLK